jgi:hypothetical protein
VKYDPVFDALMPHMAEIITSYSPLQRMSVFAEMGEYAVLRTIDEKNHLFLIYFVKDTTGVWKVEAL